MEALIPYIPLALVIVITVVIVRWRRSVRYLKPGSTESFKAEDKARSSKSGDEPPPTNVRRRKRAGPYPGIELGKRIVFGGVELQRLDKTVASDIEGRSDVSLTFDVEPDDHQFAGAIAVWAQGHRINDFVGYLPKDIARQIRDHDALDELAVRVDDIWIGDRGGAIVRVNIDGSAELFKRIRS